MKETRAQVIKWVERPDSETLKPCPFCDEAKIYVQDHLMNCPACLVSMPNELNDVEEMIACWQSRPREDEMMQALRHQQEVIERLTNLITEIRDSGALDESHFYLEAKQTLAAIEAEIGDAT